MMSVEQIFEFALLMIKSLQEQTKTLVHME